MRRLGRQIQLKMLAAVRVGDRAVAQEETYDGIAGFRRGRPDLGRAAADQAADGRRGDQPLCSIRVRCDNNARRVRSG